MRKIALLAFALFATPACAGVPCSVPFQLQNNTTADATQVMANYNALITCLGNAAAAGANNDITSLAALSTPITPAQGGTNLFAGSVSSGVNAQVVATVVPSVFSLAIGRQVSFVVGSTNTGATTLNVSGTGNINFTRRNQFGNTGMVGGELISGQAVVAQYDGVNWELISTTPVIVGEIRDYAGINGVPPPGWAFIDGSCLSRTTYADLFGVIGTAYDPTGSTCDSAHFALPDGRGRVLAGQDSMGTNGPANRITNAGSGCTGTTIGGAGCGAQNRTILQANFPAVNFTVTDPGHTHTLLSNTLSVTAGTTVGAGTSGNGNNVQNATGSSTTGISVASGGSGTPLTTIMPLQIVTKIIKL